MVINWEEAPEGTTHAVSGPGADFGWRRVSVEKNEVYNYVNGEWVERHVASVEAYLRINAGLLTEKPEEAVLPNGLQWPEGYDYWNPFGTDGFFFNEEGYIWYGRVCKWLYNEGFPTWQQTNHTIHRYGKGAEVVKVEVAQPQLAEQPAVKKKPVGWW